MISLFSFLTVSASGKAVWGSYADYFASLLLIFCLTAIWFYFCAIYGAIALFNRPRKINSEFHPPISILKPICGLNFSSCSNSDADFYNSLASFCCQNYPLYQVIFSLHNSADPSIEVVKKIIYDFSEMDIQLVVSDRTIGTNPKVNNLSNAIEKAKYPILLLADSDIQVGADYLQQLVQPLIHPKVGVVTCLYRSVAQGWAATLEALGIATEFHPGILVSSQLEEIKFALGSTIVIRRTVLEAIGGFEAIADYLADDFQLGYLPVQAGYKVILSSYVVEHVLSNSTFLESWKRQTRWAQGTRVCRPWGYLGLIFTHGTVTSLLFLLATGGAKLGWTVLVITWAVRLLMAWFIGVASLNDPAVKKFLWLVPLRDIISFAIWCYGFVGNTVRWRGQQFKLLADGKLVVVLEE